MKRKPERSPEATTISISLSKEFRDKITAAAEADGRTRSNYIIQILKKAIAANECTDGHHCPASECGAKKAKVA